MASTAQVQNIHLWNRTAGDADGARASTLTMRGTSASTQQTGALATLTSQHAGTGTDAKARLVVQLNNGVQLQSSLLVDPTHVDFAATANVPQLAVGAVGGAAGVSLVNQNGVLVVGAPSGSGATTVSQTVVTTPVTPLQTSWFVRTSGLTSGGPQYTPVGSHLVTLNSTVMLHSSVSLVDSRTLRFNTAGQYRVHVSVSLVPQVGVAAAEYTVCLLAATPAAALPGPLSSQVSRAYVTTAADPQLQEHVFYATSVAANTAFHVLVAPAAGSPALLREVATATGPVASVVVHYLGVNGV